MPDKPDLSGLSDAALLELYKKESSGAGTHELPFDIDASRERALDSPHHLATQIIDPFYEEHFEHRHAQLLDECLAPWVLGETTRIEGVNYEPSDYLGIIVIWPRSTYKSSCARLLVTWAYPYYKIRLKEDLTCMYVHQVQAKAIDHGEGMRATARFNPEWQERFPEFKVDTGKDWDRMDSWRWPHFSDKLRQVGLWSFVAYGESSSKIGGHYKLRMCDDWETDESVTSQEMISQSERKFRQFDNLKIRGRKNNPWLVMGTYYHYDGPYRRLERGGGWLSWRVPGHTGSPKAIFDRVGIDTSDDEGRAQVKAGLAKLNRERSHDLTFPKLLPWEELYKAALGQRSDDDGEMQGGFYEYSCQILCNPIAEGQARFSLEALEKSWVDEIPPPSEMWLYIRIDPAIGEKQHHSETAIVLGGVDWRGHRYLLRTSLRHEPRPVKTLIRAFKWVDEWREAGYDVINIGIESVAFQETMVTQARDGVQWINDDGVLVLRKAPCPMTKIKRSATRKTERILEMDGPVSRGELHFWTKDPMNKRVHRMFCHFPFDKFDALDATHDLWKKTQIPPKALGIRGDQPMTPEEILTALKMGPRRSRGKVTDAAGSSRLARW